MKKGCAFPLALHLVFRPLMEIMPLFAPLCLQRQVFVPREMPGDTWKMAKCHILCTSNLTQCKRGRGTQIIFSVVKVPTSTLTPYNTGQHYCGNCIRPCLIHANWLIIPIYINRKLDQHLGTWGSYITWPGGGGRSTVSPHGVAWVDQPSASKHRQAPKYSETELQFFRGSDARFQYLHR